MSDPSAHHLMYCVVIGFLNAATRRLGDIKPHLGPAVLREAKLLYQAEAVYGLLYDVLKLEPANDNCSEIVEAWQLDLQSRDRLLKHRNHP